MLAARTRWLSQSTSCQLPVQAQYRLRGLLGMRGTRTHARLCQFKVLVVEGAPHSPEHANELCKMLCAHASSCMLQVPVEALIEYWTNLPDEHRTALFQLRDEDFAAELDAQLKYQLRICKDCRGNVTRAFR